MPVSVFGCFCISGFHITRTARKNPEKLYKNQRSGSFHAAKVGPDGGHQGSRCPGHAAPLQAASGGAWAPLASSDAPFGIYLHRVPKPSIPDPFSTEAIPISAAIATKFQGTRIPVPAPCQDGEVPPDSSPSTLLPPSMMRE